LSSLGVRNIHLSPNISANWTKNEIELIPQIYDLIGKIYLHACSIGKPKYINLIDSKIAVILRGGYRPLEKCKMGCGEYAFAPSGNIYPCERLIESDDGKTHCIGNVNNDFLQKKGFKAIDASAINTACGDCGIKDYCLNWCGCSNYFSTGRYNLVSPFTCASEKALINTAFNIIQNFQANWPNLSHHLDGTLIMNVISTIYKENESAKPTDE
jgi:uncharacterized protein